MALAAILGSALSGAAPPNPGQNTMGAPIVPDGQGTQIPPTQNQGTYQANPNDPNDPVLNAAVAAHIKAQDPNGFLSALLSSQPVAALAKAAQKAQGGQQAQVAQGPSRASSPISPTPPPTAPISSPTPATAQDAPPPPDPQIGQLLDKAEDLRRNAATFNPPSYPGMTPAQALVGIAGAVATVNNPHAEFVRNYLPALATQIDRQYGSSMQGWEASRQGLLDVANALQSRAMGIQNYQAEIYKAQMGVYGQQVRGIGAAQIREGVDPTTPSPTAPEPSDPNAGRVQLLRARGIPDQAAAPYLPVVTRLPDAEAATWVGNHAAADQLVSQAATLGTPAPGRPLDLGAAHLTINSIGTAAQALHSQISDLQTQRKSLATQFGAASPGSDAARNLQAGIDQYDQAIRLNGAQLDRLAGASRQLSAAIGQRSAADAAAAPSPTMPGANALNQANARLQYVGGHSLGLPVPGGLTNPDNTPMRGVDLLNWGQQAVMTGRDPRTGAPITRQQVVARLKSIGYTVK